MKLKDKIYLAGSGFIGISGELDCHIYLVDGGTELALIDTGAGVKPEIIVENIKNMGFNPGNLKKVVLTHVHPDHAGGAAWFKEKFNLDVYVPEGEMELLTGGSKREIGLEMALKSGGYFPEYKFNHCEGIPVSHNEILEIGKLPLRTIITPGHSLNTACYLLDNDGEKDLFSGDTVMMNGYLGLLNCPGFSMKDYREVTAARLAELEFSGLFPGHMMFIVKNGGPHVKNAVDNLNDIGMPPHIGQV